MQLTILRMFCLLQFVCTNQLHMLQETSLYKQLHHFKPFEGISYMTD